MGSQTVKIIFKLQLLKEENMKIRKESSYLKHASTITDHIVNQGAVMWIVLVEPAMA